MLDENKCHQELILYWFHDMKRNRNIYREPILEESTMEKVKIFCDSLNQDVHVFVMSVEIIEAYIVAKTKKRSYVKDPFLLIVTSIYLSAKYVGEMSEFKPSNIISLYNNLTEKFINIRIIKNMEIDIMNTLSRLPIATTIDDLKTLLQYYIVPFQFSFVLTYLCEELLSFYMVHRLNIFLNLKREYVQNNQSFKTFYSIYSSRMYVPIGVILCSMKLAEIQIPDIVIGFSHLSNIHYDHLNFLCDHIHREYLNKT